MSVFTDVINNLMQNRFAAGNGPLIGDIDFWVAMVTQLETGVTPIGAAGGDLGGNYPNPTVVGLQTYPVDPTAPLAGELLTFNGLKWIAEPNASAFHPGYQTNRYYTIFPSGGNNLATFGTDAMRFCPIYISKTTTLKNLAIEIRSAIAGTLRLGIYDNLNGKPNNLLLDAGTVSTAVAQVVTTPINLVLNPGWYFLAAAPAQNTSVTTPEVDRQAPFIGQDVTTGFGFDNNIKVVGNFSGALPNPAGVIAYENNVGFPLIAWSP